MNVKKSVIAALLVLCSSSMALADGPTVPFLGVSRASPDRQVCTPGGGCRIVRGKPAAEYHGSAVCVGRTSAGNLLFVTAAHILKDRPERLYVTLDGRREVATMARIHRSCDFATFEVASRAEVECAEIGAVEIGERISTEGYGEGGRLRRIDGTITGGDQARTSSPVVVGDSGGGVYDSSGDVVGVITHSDLRELCLFSPIANCRDWIRRHYPGWRCQSAPAEKGAGVRGIAGMRINDGNLEVQYTDSPAWINLGYVTGPKGDPGPTRTVTVVIEDDEGNRLSGPIDVPPEASTVRVPIERFVE